MKKYIGYIHNLLLNCSRLIVWEIRNLRILILIVLIAAWIVLTSHVCSHIVLSSHRHGSFSPRNQISWWNGIYLIAVLRSVILMWTDALRRNVSRVVCMLSSVTENLKKKKINKLRSA